MLASPQPCYPGLALPPIVLDFNHFRSVLLVTEYLQNYHIIRAEAYWSSGELTLLWTLREHSCRFGMIDVPVRTCKSGVMGWLMASLTENTILDESLRLECCFSFGASICVFTPLSASQSEPLRRVSLVFSCSRLCEPHNDHSALLVVELLFISHSKHYSRAERRSSTETHRTQRHDWGRRYLHVWKVIVFKMQEIENTCWRWNPAEIQVVVLFSLIEEKTKTRR